MKTVQIPIDVLRTLEPRVLGVFVIDFVAALPFEASQRAHVLIADALSGRGPSRHDTSALEELLGLAATGVTPERAEQKEVWNEPGVSPKASSEPPPAPRKRTPTAEVNELVRTAHGAGLRTVSQIAESTGLGRTTVQGAMKRLYVERFAGLRHDADQEESEAPNEPSSSAAKPRRTR